MLILDFPTKDDFFYAATDYLNSSWDSVVELISEFEEIVGLIDDSKHSAESERYWGSAKQTLISATALVQQAVEFYIKGRIVDVSPYLLISGSPQSWPKGCNKKDIEFSLFRTLDAQDLLKVHDTVCNTRFTDQFVQWYEKLRVIRNKVMHTVDKSLTVKPVEVIEFILFAYHYFSGSNSWFESRKQYLNKTPVNSVQMFKEEDNTDSYTLNGLLNEFKTVSEVLSPAKVKLYFNYNKKKRSLHCPSCYQIVSQMHFWDHEFIHRCAETYQLTESDNSYKCCICNYSGTISSKKCEEEDCEEKLIDDESGLCLSCFCENTL